jgi:putative addiction module killer protein
VNNSLQMIEVRQTRVFADWFRGLRDIRARARIQVRIDRLALGNPGDVKPVGDGVSELRVDYGPGYRLYVARRGSVLVILLCGGDKASQDRDIRRAKSMVQEMEQEKAREAAKERRHDP